MDSCIMMSKIVRGTLALPHSVKKDVKVAFFAEGSDAEDAKAAGADMSFPEDALRENVGAFMNALLLAKPAGLKKTSKYAGYVNAFHLCSTMGKG
ncbi:hypothetical protein YC2023_055963 [Brassica napus]